jgi:large subunit ribosomal protein L30
MSLIVIRITGQIDLPSNTKETLFRMRLRRKYAAVIMEDNEQNRKLINKIRNFVAFGIISPEMLKELTEKRGQKIDKSKPLSKENMKPFFRLHPARGGMDAKKHFGVTSKAVLGDHKDKIDELVRRML